MSTSKPELEPVAPHHPRRRRWSRAAVAMFVCAAVALYGASIGTSAASAATSFTFTGSGWGHGVGMSQWGARNLAGAGIGYEQILKSYYTGTSIDAQQTSNDLKVLVTERAPSLTLRTGGRTTFYGLAVVPGAGQTVTVTRSGSSLRFSGAVQGTVSGSVSVGYQGHGDLKITPSGYSYRYGSLRLKPDPRGGVRAIIEGLSMQEYLYGVAEMSSSWPREALKAQATAARTFAQKRRNRRSSADFDLYSSVLHQAYKGTYFQAPNWTAAVDETAGRVITHPSVGLIDALYSASSGGHTENSEIVFVTALPYLRGVPDPYEGGNGNPYASWTRTYSGAQLGQWFGLGTVTSVSILGNRGVSGRVDKATIRLSGTGGTKDVSGPSFRSTVNSRSPGQQLLSTKFDVSGAAGNTMPTGDFHTASADGSTVTIAGLATDPDGAPLVRVVSTMGDTTAVRDRRVANGHFSVAWTGSPGTRNVCVTVYDEPTGSPVSLGCRDVVVK